MLLQINVRDDGEVHVCSAYLLGATDLRSSDLGDRIAGRICTDEPLNPTSAGTIEDVDGDGLRDFLDHGDMYADGCILASSMRPDAGWIDMADAHRFCFGTNGNAFGLAADLDGDGVPELLQGDQEWGAVEGEHQGRILVSEGFPIPFGDDTRW